MEHDYDPIEEEKNRENSEARIKNLISIYGDVLKLAADELKKIVNVVSPNGKNPHSSSRINVTELDLKILEKIINGTHDIMEFSVLLNKIITDIGYIKLNGILSLSEVEKLTLDEVEGLLIKVKTLYFSS